MSIWSWFRRKKPIDAAANDEAARILTALLDGNMTPQEARAMWPKGTLSQPSARTYIEYFESGLDGRGMRDPQVDRMVRTLAGLLERDAARSRSEASGQRD